MSIQSNLNVAISRSDFDTQINQAIAQSRIDLKTISLRYSDAHESWEWIGHIVPNLSYWVSIWKDTDSWYVSAITDQCGVLRLVHSDLSAALTELKLVSSTQKVAST